MTWVRIKESGLGRVGFRLVIAGWPTIYVSRVDMEGTEPDGRIRLHGLRTNISWNEESNAIDVIPKDSALTFEIVDHLPVSTSLITDSLTAEPDKATWLISDLPRAGTTATVANTTPFVSGDVVHVDMEAMLMGSNPADPDLPNLTRAHWDSDDVGHFSEGGEELRFLELTNKPRTMRGRQAFLYVFGDGDNTIFPGTQIWSGKVAREPRLRSGDGMGVWEIQIDNTARVFAQTMGSDLGHELRPRGARYHLHCNIDLLVQIHSTASRGSTINSEHRIILGSVLTGPQHYESQEAFCVDYSARILTILTAAAPTGQPNIRAVSHGPSGWHYEVITAAADARYITLIVHSPIDGDTDDTNLWESEFEDDPVRTIVPATRYFVRWADNGLLGGGARQIPRGGFGQVEIFSHRLGPRVAGTGAAGDEARKIFLDREIDPTGLTYVLVGWPGWGGRPETKRGHIVDAVDATERSITLRDATEADGSYPEVVRAYGGQSVPTVKLSRAIVFGGSIGDATLQLELDSRDVANKGILPYISFGNDFSTFAAVVANHTRGMPVAEQRDFIIGDDIELDDFYRHEMRLIGMWIGFTGTGKMVPLAVTGYTATDPSVVEVTILRDPSPSYQRMGLGSIGGAIVRTGYQWWEDEWVGPTIIHRDVTIKSRDPTSAMIEIKPRSVFPDINGRDITNAVAIRELQAATIGAFGLPYALIGFDVPFTAFDDTLLGAGVKFSDSRLPNLQGTRGVTDLVGTVIKRAPSFADGGRIQLIVHAPLDTPKGYAPAFGILSQVDISGGLTWDLTVRLGDPYSVETWAESSDALSDFAEAGNLVEVYEFNDPSPVVLTGTIDTVTDPGTIRVTFTGVWTPGGTVNWMLRFQDASVVDAFQDDFGFWADIDFTIGFPTETIAHKMAS